MRLILCEAPTLETRSDHSTGNYVPYENALGRKELKIRINRSSKSLYTNHVETCRIYYRYSLRKSHTYKLVVFLLEIRIKCF